MFGSFKLDGVLCKFSYSTYLQYGKYYSTEIIIMQFLMFNCRSILKATVILLPLLGFTWLFGLLAVDENSLVFAWLFTLFNIFQVVLLYMTIITILYCHCKHEWSSLRYSVRLSIIMKIWSSLLYTSAFNFPTGYGNIFLPCCT